MINENINLSSVVTVKVGEVDTAVLSLYATINIDRKHVNMGMEVLDKTLYGNNIPAMESGRDAFKVALNTRLAEAGMIGI